MSAPQSPQRHDCGSSMDHPASTAFSIQEICRQILQHLDRPDKVRILSLNNHTWRLVSREIWRRCDLVDYRAMMEMPSSQTRQAHYTQSIQSLRLDGSMPSLHTDHDAASFFAYIRNLNQVTWTARSMTKQADGTMDVDAGARYMIPHTNRLRPTPLPIPDWRWQNPATKSTYRLTCTIMITNRTPTLGHRIARVRDTLQPFTHEPISRWEIAKHTWSGEELQVLAEILEERHKEPHAMPVKCICLPCHLTHVTSLLAPLKRITSLGTKIAVELLPCHDRSSDNASCNDTRQIHLYSMILPYISRTTAWFTVMTDLDHRGNLPMIYDVEGMKDDFPVGLVDEIVYACYASRLLAHWSNEDRNRAFRQTCRPYIPIWTRIARPGCRVMRDYADYFGLEKGAPEDALKSEVIAAADSAIRSEVESAGLRWVLQEGANAA